MSRQVSRIFHRSVRSFSLITYQYMTGTTRYHISFHRVNTYSIIGKRSKIVIFILILVQLCSPNLWSSSHPRFRISSSHFIRAFPQGQILALPQHTTGTCHIVHIGFLVSQNTRVAQADRIQRNVCSKTTCFLRFVGLFLPIVFQSGSFFLSNLNYRTVLRRLEVHCFHYTFIKMSQMSEILEVGCFSKAEVMWTNTEDIVHHYPFVFTDTFPYIRSFTSPRFKVNPTFFELITTIDRIRHGHLNTAFTGLCHIHHAETSVGQCSNICIQCLNFRIGIFKQHLRFCHQFGKVIICISVIQLALAITDTHGEINHHLTFFGIVYGFRSPSTTDITKFFRIGLVHTHIATCPINQVK